MEYLAVLKCLAAPERLRILNLLDAGPLCVCHIQDILEAQQVKISKHLATMKQLGLIECEREGTWMVYRLSSPVHELAEINLKQIRKMDEPIADDLLADLKSREKLIKNLTKDSSECPDSLKAAISCC